MFTRAKTFPLVAVAVVVYSSCASAAVFELSPSAGAGKADIRRVSGTEGLYQMLRIDHTGPAFPSLKARTATPGELPWVAINDTGLIGLKAAFSYVDSTPYSPPATGSSSRNSARSNSGGSPEERTAPEIWMVILIGAGLIWSHLRSKARRRTIRFTAN